MFDPNSSPDLEFSPQHAPNSQVEKKLSKAHGKSVGNFFSGIFGGASGHTSSGHEGQGYISGYNPNNPSDVQAYADRYFAGDTAKAHTALSNAAHSSHDSGGSAQESRYYDPFNSQDVKDYASAHGISHVEARADLLHQQSQDHNNGSSPGGGRGQDQRQPDEFRDSRQAATRGSLGRGATMAAFRGGVFDEEEGSRSSGRRGDQIHGSRRTTGSSDWGTHPKYNHDSSGRDDSSGHGGETYHLGDSVSGPNVPTDAGTHVEYDGFGGFIVVPDK